LKAAELPTRIDREEELMSAIYKELLIETREQYEELTARYSALLRKKRLTTDEKVLERLLELLLQDYDRSHRMPPDDSALTELR